jgi:hypothetical protein
MKNKIIYIMTTILALAMVFALSACGTNDNQPLPVNETGAIMEYFPFTPDTLVVYQGMPDESMNQMTFAGFIEGNTMQRVVQHQALMTTEVFRYANGELRLTYANPVAYDFINVMDEPPSLNYLLLKEPLAVGTSWSMTGGGDTTEIVSMEEEVITPYGDFTAMKVVTTYQNGEKLISYYAKGIGLVKQTVFWDDNVEMSYALHTILEDTRAEVAMGLFWFDEIEVDYADERVIFSFATNDDILGLLAETIKAEGENYTPVITPNTRFISASIDNSTSTLTLDVSGEFISEMNLSAPEEEIMLQQLANTLGNFFQVQRFIMTVEGKIYKSNNFEFIEGGFLLVEGQQPNEGLVFEADGN